MSVKKTDHKSKRAALLAGCLMFCVALFWWGNSGATSLSGGQKGDAGITLKSLRMSFQFQGKWEKRFELNRGETFELSVSLPRPSALPEHGRVGVRWTLIEEKKGLVEPAAGDRSSATRQRQPEEFGIYTLPTDDWKKVLHALDPDVYLVYRAPVTGRYSLELAPVTDEVPVFEGSRWRESGTAPQAVIYPRKTPWPAGKSLPITVSVNPLELRESNHTGTYLEQEPNDTPEQAQEITLVDSEAVESVRINGGADEIEYFDNGKVG